MQFSLIDLQKIKNDLQYEKIFAHGQARKDIIKKISAKPCKPWL